MPLIAIRGKTECPRRVSVSLRSGFDSHRLHYLKLGTATRPGLSFVDWSTDYGRCRASFAHRSKLDFRSSGNRPQSHD